MTNREWFNQTLKVYLCDTVICERSLRDHIKIKKLGDTTKILHHRDVEICKITKDLVENKCAIVCNKLNYEVPLHNYKATKDEIHKIKMICVEIIVAAVRVVSMNVHNI